MNSAVAGSLSIVSPQTSALSRTSIPVSGVRAGTGFISCTPTTQFGRRSTIACAGGWKPIRKLVPSCAVRSSWTTIVNGPGCPNWKRARRAFWMLISRPGNCWNSAFSSRRWPSAGTPMRNLAASTRLSRIASTGTCGNEFALAKAIYYEPEPLACCRMHAAAESSHLMRTGANVVDERRSIEFSCASLPRNISGSVRRLAKKAAGVRAERRARQLWMTGHRAAAWRQFREGIRCSLAPAVLARSFYFLLRTVVH